MIEIGGTLRVGVALMNVSAASMQAAGISDAALSLVMREWAARLCIALDPISGATTLMR